MSHHNKDLTEAHEDPYWIKRIEYYLNKNAESLYEIEPFKVASVKNLTKKIISATKLKDGGSFIEIGCGSGILTCEFFKHGIMSLGVDVSSKAIEFSKIVARDLRLVEGKLKFINDDLDNIQNKYCDSFNLSASFGLIEHYDGLEKQIEVFNKHANLSSEYILIAEPNLNSPIFKKFLSVMDKNDMIYEEEHFTFHVDEIVKQTGVQLVLEGYSGFMLDSCPVLKSGDKTIDEISRILLKHLSVDARSIQNYQFSSSDIANIMNAENEIISSFDDNVLKEYSVLHYYLFKK